MRARSNSVIAGTELRQGQTCAELVRSFARLAPRLHKSDMDDDFQAAMDAFMPAVIQRPEAPTLRNALAELDAAVRRAGRNPRRLQLAREAMHASSERMMQKPSDEPEAAAVQHELQ
ncbi:hypothetical protein [Pseudarthrobacter sp. NamE5]|uniref:hypothetical protein n=1 Tax=Pseudarthrobacter sp. NamE5 TaxID=2576839 RepID=UPI00110B4DAE|nr:hypothetical protein [Pseudarthrobacter sp. NamE5]TLM81810.1 hypothetical protein FDW84_17380 [Pseudarthrobacter sp. NamE5]